MVKIIIHRVNSLKELKKVPQSVFGVETDIRDYKNKLVLSHNPNTKGENFYKFVKEIDRTIFLNVKSSGLIKNIIKSVEHKEVYFLDISFTEIDYLMKFNLSKKILLRFSCYEDFDLNNKYFKKIKWIWYDYFNDIKISIKHFKYLKKHKKKICIVSPDLLGKQNKIKQYINYLNKNDIKVDAVCVKKINAEIWNKYYNY